MDIFLSSLKTVAPLFMYMAMGFIINRLGITDDIFGEKVTKFCFKFAMPIMLMNNMYKADIVNEFSFKLIIFYALCTAFIVTLSWLTIPRFVENRGTCGAIIQAIYRGNFMLFAFHIVTSMYGDAALGLSSAVFAIETALYNLVAVIVLSHFGAVQKPPILKTLKDIALNPLILGTAAGIILSLSGISLGDTVNGVLDDIGALVTPIMLIALGSRFEFKSARKNVKYIITATVGRLIIAPAIIIAAAVLLNFRGMELGILVALSCAPAASSSYPMACHYGCDGNLAGEIIVFSSAFSTFTIFLILYILKHLSLL